MALFMNVIELANAVFVSIFLCNAADNGLGRISALMKQICFLGTLINMIFNNVTI